MAESHPVESNGTSMFVSRRSVRKSEPDAMILWRTKRGSSTIGSERADKIGPPTLDSHGERCWGAPSKLNKTVGFGRGA